MKLVFISSSKYPNGGAAVNRHIAYAKGLEELGHEIIFLLLKKQEWKGKEASENKIRFVLATEPETKENSKIKRIKSFFKAIKNAKNKIIDENKKNKISAVILLDTDVLELISFLRWSKKLGLKVFHERTEYPFVVSGNSIYSKISLSIYLRFVLKRFDGIYVINKALKKYFFEKTSGRVPITIINMIVDHTRFECAPKPKDAEQIISYCGTFEGDKDGVPILIESFALIANEFPDVKLQLIGSLKNAVTSKKIESLIKLFNLQTRVILTGSIKRDKIPELLCNSHILALSRPKNKQAEGGFPTKLGEYLATGNLVVVTDVGEITEFLTDKQNAFIAEPNSAFNFSEKLREALLSEEREKIGLEGKKLVFNQFNYSVQSRLLEKMFIDSFNCTG